MRALDREFLTGIGFETAAVPFEQVQGEEVVADKIMFNITENIQLK